MLLHLIRILYGVTNRLYCGRSSDKTVLKTLGEGLMELLSLMSSSVLELGFNCLLSTISFIKFFLASAIFGFVSSSQEVSFSLSLSLFDVSESKRDEVLFAESLFLMASGEYGLFGISTKFNHFLRSLYAIEPKI